MFKKLSILLLIISTLLLSSCSLAGSLAGSLGGSKTNMIHIENDEKVADGRLVKILEAIKSKDKNGLKAMFSIQALDKADDIDGKIDYLFSFFQGKVTSWVDNSGGPIVYESNDYGHMTKELISFYNVNTDGQEYLFFILKYSVDTDHPENVGLYTLRVIKAEDEKTQFGYWTDMKIAGIYKPKK